MSKLSFRARALDASKPMPIYLAEELPDLPDYSAINRAVPQMPSGMEKEEECEHHLQRAICAGLIIPTPEVMDIPDPGVYDRLYPADYKMSRQLIHMQPLGLEQDVPDYDMDSEDERWLKKQQLAAGSRKCDLTELKFEETMERLERSSGQTVVTLKEAKALAGKSGPAEHLLAAVYDYWLNKRLAVQQPLLLSVRTEARPGAPSPYLAFRRRTEKMQTRKNRKNDESSYEKMVKLRRGLSQAVTLLDMMRQREKMKKEYLKMTIVILEKRYHARDFSGHMVAEVAAQRVSVPQPMLAPPYTAPLIHRPAVDPLVRQREKRQYKRRKHLHHSSPAQSHTMHGASGSSSSSEGEAAETVPPLDPSGPFAFRRKPGCHYHMPTASFGPSDEEPWRIGCAKENTFPGDPNLRHRYSLTSLRHPSSRFIGFARRRLGRGGRVILDRLCSMDKLWESMDYTIIDSHAPKLNKNKICSNVEGSNVKSQDDGLSDNSRLLSDTKKTNTCVDVTSDTVSTDATMPWCFTDIKIKTEPEDSTSLPLNEQIDRIIKMEVDQCESNVDYNNETLNNYVTGCVSVISDNNLILDNSSNEIIPNNNNNSSSNNQSNHHTVISSSTEEHKRINEMLVQQSLRKHEVNDNFKTADEVDEILRDCIHFRPSSPTSSSPIQGQSENQASEDLQLQLTDAQISVQVLPPLYEDSGDALFHDSSLYSTSEFTLSALYGDSLLSDVCIPVDPKNDWSHTNGPDKLENDTKSNNRFKDSLTENSSSNHNSAFTPSDGTPNSLISGDDSNHAISATNGIEWSNDSNVSDKVIKIDKVITEDIKLRDKRLTSSVFTVRSLDNEKQIFLASDKNYPPISPPQATPAPQQSIYIPISTGQAIKKKADGQGMAVVQVRAPSMVRQVIGRVGLDGVSRPPLLVAQHMKTLPGHKVVQGQKVVQQNQKVVQPVQKMIQPGNNTVTKLVQQQIGRKLPTDTTWRLSDDQIIVSSGSGGLQPTQQMVAVAVTESLKLRLQGHLLTSTPRDGLVQQSGRRAAVVQLSPSGAVSGTGSVQSVGGSQVKVVRTLTAAQRSRLLQAAGGNLSGVLQLQLQTRPNATFNSEPVEVRTAHINDSTPASLGVANTSLVAQSNANNSNNSSSTNVVVNAGQTSTQSSTTSTPGGQQRKSPMEVT